MAAPGGLSPSSGPPAAFSEVRTAVRRFLTAHGTGDVVAVACSGGPDSLALAAATLHCAGRLGLRVHGLVVDHQLQADSSRVAQTAADTLRGLGCDAVRVFEITVAGPGGPEGAARRARYAALRAASPADALVLLGHTLDDQAETVLLGLGRGSGPRSIAGMRELDRPWGRPLLGVRRAVTVAACDELGLTPWADPHNADPRFRRVRLRNEVLPLMEEVLGGGVARALARTAGQLQEDLDLLDTQARALATSTLVGPMRTGPVQGAGGLAEPVPDGVVPDGVVPDGVVPDGVVPDGVVPDGVVLDVAALAAAPAALRRRVLRRWLLDAGVPELTDAHLRAADDLIGRWSGQGAVWLPGDAQLYRAQGRLHLAPRRA